jgi:hypothetical protein
VPEGPERQNGYTIAVIRKGKEIAPNPDKTLTPEETSKGLDRLIDSTFNNIQLPISDSTTATLKEVIDRNKSVDAIPIRTT